jgi:hypothetical protein
LRLRAFSSGRKEIELRVLDEIPSAEYGDFLELAHRVLGSAARERFSGCSEPQNISRFCVRDLSVGVVL